MVVEYSLPAFHLLPQAFCLLSFGDRRVVAPLAPPPVRCSIFSPSLCFVVFRFHFNSGCGWCWRFRQFPVLDLGSHLFLSLVYGLVVCSSGLLRGGSCQLGSCVKLGLW
ncbi:hypothetical protein Rs2_23082 [Raphanus sativus]|nr:hypothetical protein Rs2_23082 [Raphanus sativus]